MKNVENGKKGMENWKEFKNEGEMRRNGKNEKWKNEINGQNDLRKNEKKTGKWKNGESGKNGKMKKWKK